MKNIEKNARFFIAVAICFLTGNQFNFALGADVWQRGKEENYKKRTQDWHLDMVGFNYTDRVIDSFSVNGEGAGNVLLSSRTNGGGKTVCCVTVAGNMSATYRIRVRWQVDGCTYSTRSKVSGEVFDNIFPYYKQANVALNIPKRIDPRHLEVHFYPDGSVIAQLTESISPPRVSLDERRPDISNFPRCRNGEKPA